MADVSIRAVFEDTASTGLLGVFGVLSAGGNIVTGLKSALDLVGQAFDAAYNFGNQFVQSASESQLAMVGLQNVLNSTNNSIGLTAAQLADMSSALQNTTMFSDEQVQSAEAMLLRFENLNNIFPQAIQLTTDYAASLGIDLTSAAQTVGKALDDPASGIGRLNTQFKLFNDTEMTTIKTMAENGDVAGAQALIMERLTEKVGGAAAAFGETFAGQLTIAQNKMDDVKELIGGALLPVLTDLLDKFIAFANQPAVIQFFTDFANGLQAILNGTQNLDLGALAQQLSNWAKSVDWNQVSKDIADGINSIDWAQVGQTLSQVTIAILDTLKTVLANIDWGALLSAFIGAFYNFLAGIAGFSGWGDLLNQVGSVLKYEAYKLGQEVVQSIADGIVTSFNVLVAAGKEMVDLLVAVVKLFFGISSPSSVFADIGKNIVLGLIEGWSSLFGSFLSVVNSGVSAILSLFEPILALFGFSTGGSTGGGSGGNNPPGGGTTGGGTGTGGGAGGGNVYNFYGPVYACQGADGSLQLFDCPSPNPFMQALQPPVGGGGGGPVGGKK